MTDMGGVAVQPTVDARAQRARLVRVLLALVLLGGWVTWAAITYQQQLRVVSVDTFHDDLAGGDIVAFRPATNVRHDKVWLPDGSPDAVDLPATNEDGTLEPHDGVTYGPLPTVVYWTDSAVGPVRVLSQDDPRSPSAEGAIQELRDAGVPPAGPGNDWPSDTGDIWGLLTALVALAAVVMGPAPTRGTRWFWFWLLGLTWGLGVVAYAVAELVRPRAVPLVAGGAAKAERAGPDGAIADEVGAGSPERLRGWTGLLIGLAVGFVLSALGSAFSQAVGGVWVPLP
jgi:hypothetical protein